MYASPNIFKKVSTPMTFILLAINTLGYIIEVILSRGAFVLIDTDVLIFLGQYNLLVLKYGWWWQLITSMFIHRSIMHFLFNMFWLWLLGVQYERMFGGESLIFTYVLSGLAGNILTLLLSPLNVVSLGASGAIFGIFGVLLLFQAIVSGKILQSLAYGFIIFIINIGFNVNIWAHLGGMLCGAIIGYYYGKKFKRFIVPAPVTVYRYT